MAEAKEYAQSNPTANLKDNNNMPQYVEEVTTSWALGTMPVDDKTTITTKIVGNAQLGIGIKAPMLDVATPLVFPPAIIVVLQVPAMYTVDGEPSIMAKALKDMFESHAKAVTGIDISYSNEAVGSTLVGADGQNIVSPGKVTRAQPTPSFNFTEVTGNLYWNIIRKWMTDFQNPDTYGIGAGTNVSGAWTMSDYSMTFIAIQPDITQRPERILDAAVFCNVFPQGTGDLGMERSLNTMKNMERSFTFNAIVQHNHYTKMLGKLIMEKLQMHQLDFNWAAPQRNIWTNSLDNLGLENDQAAREELYRRGDEDDSNNVSETNAQSNDYDKRDNVSIKK